ncbi:MAG: penicillin-binding protein [Candidatus Levybacteria bacterium]|nr:penicillin-binding protein [Candidatus Levybacteria bacterium]
MDYYRSRRRRGLFKRGKIDIFTLSKLTKYVFFGLIGFVLLMAVLFVWYSRDLPTPGKLVNADLEESTRIYDRDGILLYSVFQNENRTYVKLADIPKQVQQATIAIEDKDFYENQGFSITGYIRGLLIDPILRRRVSGGSTITQQLVKNVLLTSERSLPRKIKELMLAIQVDRKYTKDQILEMYLNDVPYGGANIGVEAAAESYFGKKVQELNLSEAAFLAGLPQSPSVYSPFSGKKYYIERTAQVLGQMKIVGYINQKQADEALLLIKKKEFKLSEDKGIKAPHFVMYVRQLLAEQFGEAIVANGGLAVTTTLDWEIEKEAEMIVKSEIDKIKGFNVGNGAAVVMSPGTGEILAMVGSKDYFDTENDGNFNAALGFRQPGSSLKPIMYATAFAKGYTPSTMVMDVKTEFPSGDPKNPIYNPSNYDGKYNGPIQLRFALGNSINVPAVKMLAKVGIRDVMQNAYNMGIENWEPTQKNIENVGLSLVLGGREATLLQEVTAFSVLANAGVKQDPVAILKVVDSKGNTLYENKKRKGNRVLPANVVYLVSHILLDNVARALVFGPNSYLNIPGKTVSAKTGTTDDKRDNWTLGYTPSYTVGVWVGNNDNSPMNPAIASGATGASPIWYRIMNFLLKGKADEQPIKPDDVIALQVDAVGGGLPVDGHSTRSEYFIKGTEPTSTTIYQKIPISRKQPGKKANQDEINHGDYDNKDFIVFSENDPVSTDGQNRWQKAIDDWIEQYHKDDPLYHPPKETSDYKYGPEPTPSPTPTPTPTPTP